MDTYDVFIVDDDELVLEKVRRSLCGTSLKWHGTTDAIEAFSFLQDHNPSVLIVDQRMPRIDGIDLLEQVHAITGLDRSDVYLCTTIAPPKKICQRAQNINSSILPKAILCDKIKLLDLLSGLS